MEMSERTTCRSSPFNLAAEECSVWVIEESCGAVRRHSFFHSCTTRLLSNEYVTAQWPLAASESEPSDGSYQDNCWTTTNNVTRKCKMVQVTMVPGGVQRG
jgi:hypothetical protein